MPESSFPSVGSNILGEPPPSPATAYYADCNAYHFVGTGVFSLHEISKCRDPRGGSVAIYLTVSKCQRSLDTLTLHSTPYDANYVEGLYSGYTCSNDDSYPEAKGGIEKSSGSSLEDFALTSRGYVIDSDSDSEILINTSTYVGEDD
jgi:hypothetical protein